MHIYIFTVDALGNPEAIIPQMPCRKIVIRQRDVNGTLLDFNLYGPDRIAWKCYQGGAEAVIEGAFAPGVLVGYIETTSGADVFVQSEFFLW